MLANKLIYEMKTHKDSGIDGYDFLGLNTEVVYRHTIKLIINKVLGNNDDVSFILISLFARIGYVLVNESYVAKRIEEVIFIGESFTYGNNILVAELNIYLDSKVASIVFESGLHIKMFGLNTSLHKACTKDKEVERNPRTSITFANRIFDLRAFYSGNIKRILGVRSAYLHDICPAAVFIETSILSIGLMNIDLEFRDKLTKCMAFFNHRHISLASYKLK